MSSSLPKSDLTTMAISSQGAFRSLSKSPSSIRNQALTNIAQMLRYQNDEVLEANRKDYTIAKDTGMNDAMLDRLLLTPERLQAMANDIINICALEDPLGETIETYTMDNGLALEKLRVPLGVIASIYESRPNVTVDISALCLKSGNTCLLRGGSESINSNIALVELIHRSLSDAGLPVECVQYLDDPDRNLITQLLSMKQYIDLLIPRGGEALIRFVSENASMPVVTGGIGVCHTFVDMSADLKMARSIILNAKVQRPTVCNALDTILIHRKVANELLPPLSHDLINAGVELHCDSTSFAILSQTNQNKIIEATEDDWGKEFLSLIAAIKIVDSLDAALDHISNYGSGHSDAIITEDGNSGTRFLNEVDSCAVYLNASTRFTDGAQFGMGAEVGISTQKFHARGPMGLKELTSYKWIARGTGQIRD